jgi:hypothetical protein
VLSTTGDWETDLGAEIDRSGSRRVVRFALTADAGQQNVVQIDTGQTLDHRGRQRHRTDLPLPRRRR